MHQIKQSRLLKSLIEEFDSEFGHIYQNTQEINRIYDKSCQSQSAKNHSISSFFSIALGQNFPQSIDGALGHPDYENFSIIPNQYLLFSDDAMKSEAFQESHTLSNKEEEYAKQDIKTPDYLIEEQPMSPSKIVLQMAEDKKLSVTDFKCRCKNSQCLKMYCQCFKNGRQCNGCGCRGCKNTQSADQRSKMIEAIKKKEPAAFDDSERYKGCKCKKSGCLKGYCDCFMDGLICGKYCSCQNCANTKDSWKKKEKKERMQKNRMKRMRIE